MFSSESLYAFLNSAMNVEYVCLILVGICQCTLDNNIEHVAIKNFKIEGKSSWNINDTKMTTKEDNVHC